MNTSAAVRGLFRIPRAGPAFRRFDDGADARPRCGRDVRIESIRNILTRDGYTITQLSALTRRRYGGRSPYFVPATFLYQLRSGVTPHVCQIVALSESTGYRFADWLRLCGFELQQIPRLQMQLHPERTVLVTPIEDSFGAFPPELLTNHETTGWRGALCSRPGESGGRRYLFARIGTSDALVCPWLTAGGMVRVDRCFGRRVRGLDRASLGSLLWLVEQSSGLTCGRVKWIDDRQIVLLPVRPPWGVWPLRVPAEARILGLVDMDVRLPQVNPQPRAVPMSLQSSFPPSPFPPLTEERMRFSDLLRISRMRSGLTFRSAQRLTRAVAQILASPAYAIGLGMLSDYEAMGRLPRHIAKILSLCVVYCMDLRDLMEAAGVAIDDSAKLPLPMLDGVGQIRSDFPGDAAHSRTSGMAVNYFSAGAQS